LTCVRTATLDDAEALAGIHAVSFADCWDSDVIRGFLGSPVVVGLIAGSPPGAFGLVRRIVAEAEILTLAVAPEHRRRGLGAALVAQAVAWARLSGARSLFLEVARDNDAALALYRAANFEEIGLRRAYYSRATGAMDALVLRRDLNR
jgi:ribosomal-protein-alanine N-acetyltransferase